MPIAAVDFPVLVWFSWGWRAPGAQQVKASAPSDYLSQLKTVSGGSLATRVGPQVAELPAPKIQAQLLRPATFSSLATPSCDLGR